MLGVTLNIGMLEAMNERQGRSLRNCPSHVHSPWNSGTVTLLQPDALDITLWNTYFHKRALGSKVNKLNGFSMLNWPTHDPWCRGYQKASVKPLSSASQSNPNNPKSREANDIQQLFCFSRLGLIVVLTQSSLKSMETFPLNSVALDQAQPVSLCLMYCSSGTSHSAGKRITYCGNEAMRQPRYLHMEHLNQTLPNATQ